MSELTPQRWSSSWTLVMVAAGSAVGFSNIWWLPVLAGQHGGAAFWLVYFICLVVLGVPVLIAEFAVGAAGEADPVTSVQRMAARSRRSSLWSGLGWMACFNGLVVAPLYVVVAGWTLAFGVMALQGQFLDVDAAAIAAMFDGVISEPAKSAGWATTILALAVSISMLGVVRGLGLAARFLVPAALALFVGVAYYSRHYGDMDAAFNYLFSVDWSAVTWRTVALAMIQAVFSLGIGTGVMIALGAYLPYKDDVPVAAFSIILLEFFLAVLAGYVIIPMVFAGNILPTGGVAMLFISVPIAFGGLANGQIFTVALYFAVLIAALTSVVALMEPAVAVLYQRFHLSRKRAVLCVGASVWLVVLACLYSLAGWRFGQWFFALDMVSRYLLPAMGLSVAVFVGWLASPTIAAEDFAEVPNWVYRVWRFALRWLAIPAMVMVWALYLSNTL